MTPMIILLCTLATGFILRKISLPKYPSWLLSVVVALLLFFFGLSVGSDKTVESEIAQIGTQALILGAGGAIGSAVAACVFLKILEKYRKGK